MSDKIYIMNDIVRFVNLNNFTYDRASEVFGLDIELTKDILNHKNLDKVSMEKLEEIKKELMKLI